MSEIETEVEEQEYTPKKRKFVFKMIALAIVLTFTVAGAIFSYNFVNQLNVDNSTKISIKPGTEVYVNIPLGSSTTAIAKILDEKSIISHPLYFKLISKLNGFDGGYQSGTHILSKDLSYNEIMRVLSSKPVATTVTIPEGYAYKQITETLVKDKLINLQKFDSIVNSEAFDYKFLKGIPQRKNRLEGYLFPDTYEFDMSSGEKEIVSRMLERFDEKFKPEYYERAKELNISVDKIIILASIIEREAKAPEEKPTIAGVFYNRLNGKYGAPGKLESCATVQYILGEVKPVLSIKDTQIDDPYNTYKYEGLPPGPICSPGEESIKAALYPEDNKYAYFVSKGDGTHYFSKTYSEHLAAARKYGVN